MRNKFKVRHEKAGCYACLFVLLSTFLACNGDDGVAPDSAKETETPVDTSIDGFPLFAIDTDGAAIVDEPKITAEATITRNGAIDFTGKIGIEIRGSSSQRFPKKSFGFETRDDLNEDMNVSLLEFPEEEDWILNGLYSDKSLMRNVLIYDLAREMNQYASRTKFVEVSINEEYQGVYVFMEKLKRDKERIDISKLNADENTGEDVTGGYIIKIDKNNNGGFTPQNSFVSQFGSALETPSKEIRFLYEYPKEEDITAPQRTYISNYINAFETALAAADFEDPINGYAQYIDTDSFIDFFLLNELANNVDGYRISTFMRKDKNEKLKMGPLWDFNLGFGNADYCGGGQTNVWAYRFNARCPDDFYQVPFWWGRLLQDTVFVVRLQNRWNELRGSTLSNVNILDRIDTYSMELERAKVVQRNFETWKIFGTYVWPNNFIGQNYQEETDFLKSWTSNRLAWLDNAISNL